MHHSLNKKRINRSWSKTKFIKTWHILLILIPLILISAWSLRQNYLRMTELRASVLSADEGGEGIDEAIEELGTYIISHMNTKMAGPVNLPYSFNREYEDLARGSDLSDEQFLKVREECVNFTVPVELQSECIRNKAAGLSGFEEVELDSALFSFDFKPPLWSPDLAGFSVLASIICTLILVVRLAGDALVKAILRHHR